MRDGNSVSEAGVAAPRRASATQLWFELIVLFVGTPLLLALFAAPNMIFPVLGVMTLVGGVLLSITPGFRWSALLEGGLMRHWRATLVFALGSAGVIALLVALLRPGSFFAFPSYAPSTWLMVMALYPFLSALPQEVVFRALFFERYGALFGGKVLQIAVNAALFGLAHAAYQNWVAVLLTAVGGAFFAWAYVYARSFPLAMVWHAIGGQLIFTLGLNAFFFHGAVQT